MAKVVLGPIVGEVNFDEARIIIEFDSSTNVKVVLKNAEQQFEQSQPVEAYKPALFVFNNVESGQQFTIHYRDQQIGSFHTVHNDQSSDLSFAVVSCNSQKVYQKLPQKKQLWQDLKKKVQNQKLDQILHIGDQVYLDKDYYAGSRDSPYAQIEYLVQDADINELDDFTEQAREILRKEYRRTWGQPDMQFVLANVSNRMILDDHEVKDDAGKDLDLVDKSSWKRWYSFDIARYVYYEYQKRLTKDVNLSKLSTQKEEYQQYIIKNSGFFLIDCRAHFLWHGDKWDKSNSYLGQKQKQALVDSLSKDGPFEDIKSLFIVSSIPMLLLGERITKLGSKIIDDVNQHWEYQHKDELVELLNYMIQWKNDKHGRVVSLISGDVHFGAHYDIYKNNSGQIKQMICSSIGNSQLPYFATVLSEIAAEMEENLGLGIHFEKHDMVFENNYGLVKVGDSFNGHEVEMGLVSNQGGVKQEKRFNNFIFKKKGGGCCSIF